MDSERKLEEYFFLRYFQRGFSKGIQPFLRAFQSVSTFKRVSKRFRVPGIASNILRNKAALEFVQSSLYVALYTKQDFLFHIDTTLMVVSSRRSVGQGAAQKTAREKIKKKRDERKKGRSVYQNLVYPLIGQFWHSSISDADEIYDMAAV